MKVKLFFCEAMKNIPVFGQLFVHKWENHKRALGTIFISWVIINIPILLKFLKDINENRFRWPFSESDVIVYSISFLAPFVFCSKIKKENGLFNIRRDTYWVSFYLIVLIAILSFYFSQDTFSNISKIIIWICYILSFSLWYIYILLSEQEEHLYQQAENAIESNQNQEQNFSRNFDNLISIENNGGKE